MMTLEIDKYVELSSRTASEVDLDLPVRSNTLHAAIGLAGESGEVLDCVKKAMFYGQPLDTANLREEAGDIIWYLALLCRSEGFDIKEIMQENIDKLYQRYPEKFSREHAKLRLDKV